MTQKATKTTAKRSTTSRPAKKTTARAATGAGKKEVTMDRRHKDRRSVETCEAEAVAAPKLERRQKVSRRRQIDPTTCERDYSEHEVEFMNALDDYKRKSGRMFPTCSEVLEVIRSLGYVKQSPAHTCTCAAPVMAATSNPSMVPAWVGFESVAEVVS